MKLGGINHISLSLRHAVFFLDPDGSKLELAHTPGADWQAG
jgi:hypothetical protein